MSARSFAFTAVALAAAVAYLWLLSLRDAKGMSEQTARARAQTARVELHRARGTLRFFEHHPQLLYKAPARTRRIAWREVRRAGTSIRRASSDLSRALSAIPYRPPWPWSCIYSKENAGQGWTAVSPDGKYRGGLQFDAEFELDYGARYVKRWGHADRWPPRVQVLVAERARDSGRGYHPWPRTAAACGVLR